MARGKYKLKRLRQQRRVTPIQNSGLSERVIHILEAHGVNSLYDLDMSSDDVLRAMPRIGERAMEEIHAVQVHIYQERIIIGNFPRRR